MSLPRENLSENVPNGSFANTDKYSYRGLRTNVYQRLQEGYKGLV